MRIIDQRGKWLLNRRLLDKLPLFVGRCLAAIDRALERVRPNRAWDVFLVAEKLDTSGLPTERATVSPEKDAGQRASA